MSDGTPLGRLDEPESPYPKQHQESPGLERRLDPRPRYQARAYRAADKLKDKVALVTGGDSGIGRAVALLYAREGADVAITYLPEEAADAEETHHAIEEAGGTCLPLALDVRNAKACENAVEEVVDRFGRLDILVNNAAYQQHKDDFDEVTLDEWHRTFDTNIHGYFHMVKASLPHMGEDAAIINTGSITGLEGSKGLLDYSTTKGAINAFTKSLAQLMVDRNIRVNCVAPGPVWTPLNPADRSAEEIAEFGAGQPYGRPAHPEEVAPAYVFFASAADSSYITGEVLTILGGQTRAA